MSIDLHGMTEQEAIGALMTALFSFDHSGMDQMEIITGRGYVLTRVVEDCLEEEGYEYRVSPGNPGSYIVYSAIY